MKRALRILIFATAMGGIALGSAPALMAQEKAPPSGAPPDPDPCKREMFLAALAAHQERATLEALTSSDFGIVDFQYSPTDDGSYVATVQTAARRGNAATTETYRIQATRRCRISIGPTAN
jgi:hypothetical protein